MPKGRYAQDLIGKKFNRLTVISKEPSRISATGHTYAVWLCKCECGNIKPILGHRLKKGHTKSCGCLQIETIKENAKRLKPNIKFDIGVSSCNALFSTYKKSARLSSVDFSIERADFQQLTSANCHYCGAKPHRMFKTKTSNGGYCYNGLDRKKSDGPYSLENVLTCCRTCNFAKRNMGYEEFVTHIKMIYFHLFS